MSADYKMTECGKLFHLLIVENGSMKSGKALRSPKMM
jgi:hypothetical protein